MHLLRVNTRYVSQSRLGLFLCRLGIAALVAALPDLVRQADAIAKPELVYLEGTAPESARPPECGDPAHDLPGHRNSGFALSPSSAFTTTACRHLSGRSLRTIQAHLRPPRVGDLFDPTASQGHAYAWLRRRHLWAFRKWFEDYRESVFAMVSGQQRLPVLPVDPPAAVFHERLSSTANNVGRLRERPAHEQCLYPPCAENVSASAEYTSSAANCAIIEGLAPHSLMGLAAHERVEYPAAGLLDFNAPCQRNWSTSLDFW